MGLKDVIANNKRQGSLLKDLDTFLMTPRKGSDRRIDVNSPSCAGKCMRANWYSRMRVEIIESIPPRAKRIFDNGDKVHERLQEYLLEMGRMLMAELPLRNEEYNIQGHTDGIVVIEEDGDECAIIEIKSIKDGNFVKLKTSQEDHTKQGHVYLFCAEERRCELHARYETYEDFLASKKERIREYRKMYTHLEGGRKYTKEQKIMFKIQQHLQADNILYRLAKPIDKVIFWYEDKDNQEIKEFVISRNDDLLSEVLEEYTQLNKYVKEGKCPPRPYKNKSEFACNYCDYKIDCWN